MNNVYAECMIEIWREIANEMVQRVAKDLVSVQPMDGIDLKALRDDPLVNMLLSNHIARVRGEPLPFPYGPQNER